MSEQHSGDERVLGPVIVELKEWEVAEASKSDLHEAWSHLKVHLESPLPGPQTHDPPFVVSCHFYVGEGFRSS
jgi:hypothetical protein